MNRSVDSLRSLDVIVLIHSSFAGGQQTDSRTTSNFPIIFKKVAAQSQTFNHAVVSDSGYGRGGESAGAQGVDASLCASQKIIGLRNMTLTQLGPFK